MKKLLFLVALAIIFCGCVSYSGVYSFSLFNVKKNGNSVILHGTTKVIKLKNSDNYSYEDDYIKIILIPKTTHFGFVLENKSENTIKIIWDEAIFIDAEEFSRKIVHSGIKYNDINNSQIPTVIAKDSKLRDAVFPSDNIYYVNSKYYSGWKNTVLLPNTSSSQEKLIKLSQNYIGKTIKILLPIQTQGVVNEYIFYFNIDDFKVNSYSF